MKNFESGDRLLNDAEIYYEEMQSMYDKERWNIVVRRAQEVVELSLKGILKMMGIEYPKIHNVAPLFVKLVQEKGIKLEESMVERILIISEILAKERGPSFYSEKIYPKKDADEAKKGAKEILEWVNKIKSDIKCSKKDEDEERETPPNKIEEPEQMAEDLETKKAKKGSDE
jgi:HEPN domain-containing protein